MQRLSSYNQRTKPDYDISAITFTKARLDLLRISVANKTLPPNGLLRTSNLNALPPLECSDKTDRIKQTGRKPIPESSEGPKLNAASDRR